MKSKVLSPLLGLAVLSALASPAVAGGDWNDAGITNYSTSVPVPAPIPVPLYHPMWYFRLDVGGGFGDSTGASESGALFGASPSGTDGYFSSSPFGIDPGWVENDYTKTVVWNMGIGYYWTRKFRTDITLESLRDQEVRIEGSHSTDLSSTTAGGAHAAGDTYDLNMRDHTLVRGAVFLVNGYYELAQYGPLRPYIGAGIGFGYTDVERTNETSISVTDNTIAGGTVVLEGFNLKDRQQVTTVALAATVGVSYDLTEITQLDFAYRFLWVEGAHADLERLGSSIVIDDTTEHQFRAGVRFNVN